MVEGGIMEGKVKWEEIWEKIYDERMTIMKRDYAVDDWSTRSQDYSESRRTNNYEYGNNVLKVLRKRELISPESQVIEVGSGPGTFVIPFAPHVGHYTAVEPAEGMIERIHENATESGITNYSIVPKIWQEVDVSAIREKYDLLLSSTVIWMFRDIMEQVRRMEEVCRGTCCIAAGFGSASGPELDLWQSIMGDIPYPQYPEYPYIYNILYQNGRVPNVEVISSASVRTAERLQTMYKVFYSLYTDYTPVVEEKIYRHLEEHSQDLPEGRRVVREYQTAVVWWDPKQRQAGSN